MLPKLSSVPVEFRLWKRLWASNSEAYLELGHDSCVRLAPRERTSKVWRPNLQLDTLELSLRLPLEHFKRLGVLSVLLWVWKRFWVILETLQGVKVGISFDCKDTFDWLSLFLKWQQMFGKFAFLIFSSILFFCALLFFLIASGKNSGWSVSEGRRMLQ